MAPETTFKIVHLEKINGHYRARIGFEGSEDDYDIRTNCVLSYLPWLSEQPNFSIYTPDEVQIPRNGEFRVRVTGLTENGRKKERDLEKALEEFCASQENDLKITRTRK